jgi:hypothetical protein
MFIAQAGECPDLRAMVTSFVAEVLDVAKKEAYRKIAEKNNINNVQSLPQVSYNV